MKFLNFLTGYKTFIVGFAGLIYGLYTLNYEIIITSLGLVGLRQAISKSQRLHFAHSVGKDEFFKTKYMFVKSESYYFTGFCKHCKAITKQWYVVYYKRLPFYCIECIVCNNWRCNFGTIKKENMQLELNLPPVQSESDGKQLVFDFYHDDELSLWNHQYEP